MSTESYRGFTLDVRDTGYGGFIGLVVSGSTVVESFARDSEQAAFSACRAWADVLAAGTYQRPSSYTQAEVDGLLDAKAPLASPVFTGGVTVPTGDAIRIDCPTSDSIIACQDGTGRIAWYWNSSTGTSPTFLAAGEDAWKMLLSIDGLFVWYWADGTGVSVGDPITWQELARIDAQRFRVRTGGATSGNAANYVDMSGANAGQAPGFVTAGTDTDVDLLLSTKGSGVLCFGTYTAVGKDMPPTGYVQVKDEAGGTVYLMARTVLP